MSDNIQKDPEMILCDMCTEEDRKPARKTCMKCEISMCTQHLQVWMIGLCDKQSVKDIKNAPVYGLSCQDNQLSSVTTELDDSAKSSEDVGLQKTITTTTGQKLRISSSLVTYEGENVDEHEPRPETVEVFWNFVASTLSFFSRTGRHRREEIISIKMNLNTWDLVPFVQLGKEQFQEVRQDEWKCSCGKSYNKNGNVFYDKMTHRSYKGNCSCGKILGPLITELMCELF